MEELEIQTPEGEVTELREQVSELQLEKARMAEVGKINGKRGSLMAKLSTVERRELKLRFKRGDPTADEALERMAFGRVRPIPRPATLAEAALRPEPRPSPPTIPEGSLSQEDLDEPMPSASGGSSPGRRTSRSRSQLGLSILMAQTRRPFLSRSCREKTHSGPCGSLCECDCHGERRRY